MNIAIHTIHVLAAGIWLGGLLFVMLVLLPALRKMELPPAERTTIRSAVGLRYAKITRANLGILLIAAVIDAVSHYWTTAFITEIVLVAVVFIIAEFTSIFLGPQLVAAAREERHDDRARLLRISVFFSVLNLLLGTTIMVLATLVL